MKRLLFYSASIFLAGACFAQVSLSSPDGKVVAKLSSQNQGLFYSISSNGREILGGSPIGVLVDGRLYGAENKLGKVTVSKVRDRFAWRGEKSEVDVRARKALIQVDSAGAGGWQVELRCFNDAVAWRAIIPGQRERKVTGELSAWRLPVGTVAWCNPVTSNYEGIHERWVIGDLSPDRFTNGIAMPLTFELPGGGYAALTEANVMGYSGMTLEPSGSGMLTSSFRDDPQGWTMNGAITTPWRVLMIAPDLERLVNCDVVPSLCPPPDQALFPRGIRTDYLKPGRCLWQWWAYNRPGTLWEKQKTFVDQAAELNCAYYLVDEGWQHPDQQWISEGKTAWDRMKELCDYAATRNVGIWIWQGWTYNEKRQWPGIETREKREEFFRNCVRAGVKGVKIDFMDSESHDVLAFYEDCLRTAAREKVMVNFHGANKPAGEARTWPNEMTREGVRGLEYNKWSTLPPQHYATVPFTRYLVGHGDFTPFTLQSKFLKGTTVAQQLACAVVTTSPILCWADKPELYLESPVVDVVRSMPPVWDETHVLPGSRIGELAAFARRSGKHWYVGVINGGGERSYTVDFSFLGSGKHEADFFGDVQGDPLKFQIERNVPVTRRTTHMIRLSPGGGFTARIK